LRLSLLDFGENAYWIKLERSFLIGEIFEIA